MSVDLYNNQKTMKKSLENLLHKSSITQEWDNKTNQELAENLNNNFNSSDSRKWRRMRIYDYLIKWVEIQPWDWINLSDILFPKRYNDIVEYLELKENVSLYLCRNNIGLEGAKILAENLEFSRGSSVSLLENKIGAEGAKMLAESLELKEWVSFDIRDNEIWDEGAKAFANNLELKKWVTLDLWGNKIGDAGAKEIANNMELKEWVTLDLMYNNIWDFWARELIDNLELKEWVTLNLRYNKFSDDMKEKLKEREKSYQDKWINCSVLV